MDRNLITAILSIIVVLIVFYEIFGWGQYSWANYLSILLFAAVFVLSIYNMRNRK